MPRAGILFDGNGLKSRSAAEWPRSDHHLLGDEKKAEAADHHGNRRVLEDDAESGDVVAGFAETTQVTVFHYGPLSGREARVLPRISTLGGAIRLRVSCASLVNGSLAPGRAGGWPGAALAGFAGSVQVF